MFSVDYKQIQQAWIPWAQKCCLGESHIKKAMQAFIDFLTPPEMREEGTSMPADRKDTEQKAAGMS